MGTKNRRLLEKESRAKSIVEAAENVMKVHGLQGLNMDLVAQETELAKGTLYLYFDSKEKILAELSLKARLLLLDKFNEITAKIENPLEQISAIVWANYEFQQEYPLYSELLSLFEANHQLTQTPELLGVSDKLTKIIAGIIDDAKARRIVKPDLDSQHFAFCLWGMTVGMMLLIKVRGESLRGQNETSVEKMLETFVRVLVNGIKK